MKDLNSIPSGDDRRSGPSTPQLTLPELLDVVDTAANVLGVMLNDPSSTALDHVSDADFDRLDTEHNNLRTTYKTLRRVLSNCSVRVD